MSMMPGIKVRPPASTVSRASSLISPIPTILPASTATSACFGSWPRPSTTVAPRITRSCMSAPPDLFRQKVSLAYDLADPQKSHRHIVTARGGGLYSRRRSGLPKRLCALGSGGVGEVSRKVVQFVTRVARKLLTLPRPSPPNPDDRDLRPTPDPQPTPDESGQPHAPRDCKKIRRKPHCRSPPSACDRHAEEDGDGSGRQLYGQLVLSYG